MPGTVLGTEGLAASKQNHNKMSLLESLCSSWERRNRQCSSEWGDNAMLRSSYGCFGAFPDIPMTPSCMSVIIQLPFIGFPHINPHFPLLFDPTDISLSQFFTLFGLGYKTSPIHLQSQQQLSDFFYLFYWKKSTQPSSPTPISLFHGALLRNLTSHSNTGKTNHSWSIISSFGQASSIALLYCNSIHSFI